MENDKKVKNEKQSSAKFNCCFCKKEIEVTSVICGDCKGSSFKERYLYHVAMILAFGLIGISIMSVVQSCPMLWEN